MGKCVLCHKTGDDNTLRRCSRCKAVRYCSRDCQARHWSEHKVICMPVDAGSAARSATEMIRPTPTAQQEQQQQQQQHQQKQQQQQPQPQQQQEKSEARPDPWQGIKTRTQEAFPGSRVIDTFEDFELNHEFLILQDRQVFTQMGMEVHHNAKSKGVVIILQLECPLYNPLRRGWSAKDKAGSHVHIFFDTGHYPPRHFRHEDLKRGHFICIKDAPVDMFLKEKMHFIHLKDINTVRVFQN